MKDLGWSDKEKVSNWFNSVSLYGGRSDVSPKLISTANIILSFDNPPVSTNFNTTQVQENKHKQHIAEHIDNVVEQLGTKARTTVYHSFDELPADMKEYIRERERQGR